MMIQTLGAVRVGAQTRFRTQKTAELLGLLVREMGRSVSREFLGEQLWPGDAPRLQRNRLRYELCQLRPLLPPGALQTQGHTTVRLSASSDGATFEHQARAALALRLPAQRILALEAALTHYQGEFMPGHYAEWVLDERIRLEALYDSVVCRLSQDYHATGQLELGRYWSQKQL